VKGTSPPEVSALLEHVLSGVREILGLRFVGMYLDGSLAIGDFEPDKSDIDFVVVTEAELPDEIFRALKAMHMRIATRASKWVTELEGSYISRHALRHDPRPRHPYIDRGAGALVIERPENGYWVIHRHVLREHGVVLAGPAPQTLIDPVSPDDLRRAVGGILHEWWEPMLAEPTHLRSWGYRCYAVLTMCRMRYTLQHGAIVTKPVAARWAMESLDPRWLPLIRDALAWSRDAAPDPNETLDFIRDTCRHGGEVDPRERPAPRL
jgi:hypothetical protein